MVAGGVTLSGLTSVASADPPDDDGPTVGTDSSQKIASKNGAGGTDREWNAYINEFVSQITPEIPTSSNPGGVITGGVIR